MSTPDPPSGPAEINRLQRWFQSVITHAEGVDSGASSEEAQQLIQLAPGQLEKVITRSRALTAGERLAIYANAYHTRLLECLGEVFPMLKRTLGDEAFDGFAFGYLQEYPSRSYTLNELGRGFPRYLHETRPVMEGDELEALAADAPDAHPSLSEDWPDFLIDLAQLEWAIYEVFDGPGVEGQPLLRADDLLDIPPERWPEAQLEPAPCLQLLTTRFPVNDYYTRLRQVRENEAVPIPAPDESFVALSRRDFVVRRYHLSRPEFELLRAIQQSLPLGRAIERAAQASSASVEELASNLKLWFRNWTAEGFFRAIRVVGPPTAPTSNARAPLENETTMKYSSLHHITMSLLACSLPLTLNAVTPPKAGDKAPDFALKTLDEQTVRLSDLTARSNVVLIVLRGWPGYQCPLCTRQVRDYIDASSGFEKAKARVVMVYPGPADDLQAHAKEFLENKQWPKDFIYLTDPDYTMVNAYGLRWNAPRETAYPATFVLDRRGNVLSAKISHSHGDRTKASDILEELRREEVN